MNEIALDMTLFSEEQQDLLGKLSETFDSAQIQYVALGTPWRCGIVFDFPADNWRCEMSVRFFDINNTNIQNITEHVRRTRAKFISEYTGVMLA